MNVSLNKLLNDYPSGVVFIAQGQSDIIYYGELDEGILVISCKQKGYTGRRLKPTSVGFRCIDIPDNDRDKNIALRAIGRINEQ